MKFTSIALLALGAAAYVVTDPSSNAVEARNPGSGPTLGSALMNALEARHHRGRKNSKREEIAVRDPAPQYVT